MRLLDRVGERRAARALGQAPVQLVMEHRVDERSRRLRGERVDARGELAQLAPLRRSCFRGEQDRRLHLERLADDEVPADFGARRDAHARAGARAALEQPFHLEPLQRLGHGQEAHAELGGELAARDDLPERQLAAQNSLTHDAVRLRREARRRVTHRSAAPAGFEQRPDAPPGTDRSRRGIRC